MVERAVVRGPGRPLLGVLGGLTALSPLATDMYVPGLAVLADDLRAPAWAVQLSLTGFLVGIVIGQLVLGPLSDRLGRRPVLLVGAVGFALASGLAALAPDVVWFDAARVVQGLFGAAGLAASRAVVTDLYDEDESAGRFATLAAVHAAGPIVAPLLGGAVLSVAPWRAVFVVLAALGLLLAAAVALWVPESRVVVPGATVGTAYADAFALLRQRRFVALALAMAFGSAAIFAYIAGAPFLFADHFGYSPAMISVVFGVNAAGNLAGALLFGRLAGRVRTSRVVRWGLGVAVAAAAALSACAALGVATEPVVLGALLVGVTAFGVFFPALTTETQNAGRSAAGGASALAGAGQYTIGAAIPPLVGALDVPGALPTAAVMACCFVLALASHLLVGPVAAAAGFGPRRAGEPPDDVPGTGGRP